VTYPKISIVTPSYNQGQFLEECIESILGQNYPNLEYVIMDGGSTDNSLDIIKKYERHLTYWQCQPDNGQYAAINKGFEKTTGEIMAWLNSDDKYHPNAFFKVAYVFTSFNTIQWIVGRPTTWDMQGHIKGLEPYQPIWAREMFLRKACSRPIQQESTFWRRSLWEKVGGSLRTDLSLASDLELWIRFFRYEQLHSVRTFIGGYRLHDNQKARLFRDAYRQEALKILNDEIVYYNIDEDKRMLPAPPVLDVPENLFQYMNSINISPILKNKCWSSYRSDLKNAKRTCDSHSLPEASNLIKAELSYFKRSSP